MQSGAKLVWDCREAETQLALQAGGDLDDPAAAALLESHLAQCPQCRAYLGEMEAALDVLQACAQPAEMESPVPALWTRVAAELPAPRKRSAYSRFNLWVPTVAMSIACAAMVLVTIVQLERVSPFEPLVTPRLHSVLMQDAPRDFFENQRFIQHRDALPIGFSKSGSLPVGFSEVGPLPVTILRDQHRTAARHHPEW